MLPSAVARCRVSLLVGAGLCLLTASASAHDYWLLPDRLHVLARASVRLSLWVGDDFVPEEERAWQRARTTRFTRLSAQGRAVDLLAQPVEGQHPIVASRLAAPGGYLFVMERDAAHLELPALRFERYLHDEGLDAIVALRAARGEATAPGRERYTRYLKAFVQAGATADGVSTRVAAQAFELVPRDDLARLDAGDSLRVEARFRGAPIAGVTVEALSRVGSDVRRARAVSDARGRVTFTLDREGTWLLRATHMVRCEGCADADWESFWTSYVFGLCARAADRCEAAPMAPAAR